MIKPTGSETKEVKKATEIEHFECRYLETVQREGASVFRRIGMIIPPNDDSVATTPNANHLCFLNHCEMVVGSEPKIIIPQQSPVGRP